MANHRFGKGEQIGMWTILENEPTVGLSPCNRKLNRWLCRCVCGRERSVFERSLAEGRSKGCGCVTKLNANSPSVFKKGNTVCVRHGHAFNAQRSRTYQSWNSMRQRCNNSRHHKYPSYGGRGIKICARWDKFENFLADMGERPDNTSLDRIDVNGDYEHGNCRWADAKAQAANRRPRSLRRAETTT